MEKIFIFSQNFKNGTKEQKNNYILSFFSNIVFLILATIGIIFEIIGLCGMNYINKVETQETAFETFAIICASIVLAIILIGLVVFIIMNLIIFFSLQKMDKKTFMFYNTDNEEYISRMCKSQYIKIMIASLLLFGEILSLAEGINITSIILMLVPTYIIILNIITLNKIKSQK